MSGYVSNNEAHVKTEAGEFLYSQRNVGYWENDGRWIVNQLSELYWDGYGYLTQKREGILLGIYDTKEEAEEAIRSATQLPELEHHKVLSGR